MFQVLLPVNSINPHNTSEIGTLLDQEAEAQRNDLAPGHTASEGSDSRTHAMMSPIIEGTMSATRDRWDFRPGMQL